MTDNTLTLSGVKFQYENMPMEFNLSVRAGDFMAIIGPSGSGKSTLLNLISGFETPVKGTIELQGADITALPPSDRPITMIFQENNLFTHLNIKTNVGLGISPALKLTPENHQQIETALERVGLKGFENRLPGELSGGERQRVAIARALVRDRPLLLLDEPFTALGPALRREMLDLVAEIHKEKTMTVIMVTHNPDDARHAATRTAFVNNGQVMAVETTETFFTTLDIPELKEYLGE